LHGNARENDLVILQVTHTTTYHYRELVSLHPHRMLLRPRESRELRLLDLELTLEPPAQVTWAQDVAGNMVATAAFPTSTDSLMIRSVATLELDAVSWPVFEVAASAASFPFQYTADEWTDLGALSAPQYPDAAGQLGKWVQRFILAVPTDTLSLLKDINAGIPACVFYQSRDVEGTQPPLDTLARGWGSCRDMAVLFVEAVRTLGFGARIVSGYLHNPAQLQIGTAGAGSTHAWAEVYVPGAGWITFDPTNRSVGGVNLIPVAVGRTIGQISPVSGSFHGPTNAFDAMWVKVEVHEVPAAAGQQV
jgi:transglutaminase-like putative cysteine protease